MFSRAAQTLFTFGASLVLTSCSFFSNEPIKLRTQEEVGTVQVAVQSVAPFEDYLSSLEPQFELKAQDAFAQAIAQTQTQDTQMVNQFLATLQIALPQITRSKTSSVTNDGTDTTTTSTTEHSSQPGTIATPSTAPGVATPTVTATLPAGTVDIDPALRYRAAAALAQEVSLLNRYVRDAAVSTGTKPYIVRLLVTVMPGSRNQPYDAYSTISFFTADEQKPAKSWFYDQLRSVIDMKDLDKKLEAYPCGTSMVRVVPLLVTDNIESSLHTNALQRIRDIAVALNGTLSNIGIGVGTKSHNEEIDKTLGKNLNSIFALGQPAPNAVVARLGAAYANGKYATVGRTYGVSVLVLAKTMDAEKENYGAAGSEVIPCPSIKFVATTQMHDAHGRSFLPVRPPENARRQLVAMLAARGIPRDPSEAGTLLADAAEGNFKKFTADFGTGDAAGAWTDALSVAGASGRSVGEFSVSIPRTSLPDNNSHFSLFDDGKAMTLTINNGANLQADRLSATVRVQWLDRWVHLTNDSNVKVMGHGTSATFTFPSLSRIRAANPDLKPDPCHIYAKVTYNRGTRSWQANSGNNVVLEWYPVDLSSGAPVNHHVARARAEGIVERDELPIPYVSVKPPDDPPAPKPGFTISSPSVALADATGAGRIVLEIRSSEPGKVAKGIRFRVVSGGFVSETPANATTNGAEYIADEGTYVLTMKHLRPRVPVIVRAFRLEGDKSVAAPDLPIEVAED